MNKFNLKLHKKSIADDELLRSIKNVAEKLSKSSISMSEYADYGEYNVSTIINRFSNWNEALEKANLDIAWRTNIDKEELLLNMQSVWTKLGRQPTRRDMKVPVSKYSYAPYIRTFGSWNRSLQSFVEYINLNTDFEKKTDRTFPSKLLSNSEEINRKTKRNISDRLRFRILMRDGFTCSKCGRSPMKERGVELHVDHIIPWSKGGETVPENLETKCSKCNLGKGNAFNV